MRERVRQREVIAGEYKRVQAYPVRATSSRRGAKRGPTSEAQERMNAENARRRLTDLIHTNFTPDDAAVHLTYRDGQMPETVKDAQRMVYNYMRRLARLWAKVTGRDHKTFRWIAVTEMSGTGRIHHHCIVSGGLTMEQMSDKWGYGHTTTKALEFDETGLVGLATYITKDRVSYRRWQASKNLDEPVVVERDYVLRKKDLRHIRENPDDVAYIEAMHPGYRVCPGSVRVMPDNEFGAGLFVSWMLYREDNGCFAYDRYGRIVQKRRAK